MMNAAASPSNSKTQKLLGGHDASWDKDLISKLPEDILVRILSFLPSTKEAIKTSILSKRWRYLWVSIPKLFFNDPSFSSYQIQVTFLGSIERALSLRNSDLVYLRIWLNNQVGASRIQSWLSAASEHNVQELILSFPEQREFVLPNSFFTSKSLSTFDLAMECTLKVPRFECFSSLKSLSLAHVAFEDDRSAQQLFSGCPLLEEMYLYGCDWENITVITIENPTLKRLFFFDHHIQSHLFDGKIMISVLTLETLHVTGYLGVELSPCNLPSLNSATIDLDTHLSHRILSLLSGIQNVKSLDVSSRSLEPLFLVQDLQGRIPTFYNLTRLKAWAGYCRDKTSGALLYIIENSPNLESLEIPKAFSRGEQNMIYESVLTCFQSSLKQFIINDFGGNEDEVDLLKYVCENAPLLKHLGIRCNEAFSDKLEKQEEIRHQLRQLRGASDSCVIEFFPYKPSSLAI